MSARRRSRQHLKRKHIKYIRIAVAILIGLSGHAAYTLTGVHAIDGDTLRVDGRKIRIWGIDAPEKDQTCRRDGTLYPCGLEAREALRSLSEDTEVKCTSMDTDKYGRDVFQCMAGGRDIAAEMVRQGWALDYTEYSEGLYKPLELLARAKKSGIWAGDFMEPEKYRKQKKD